MKKFIYCLLFFCFFSLIAQAEEISFLADESNKLYTYENNKAVFVPLNDDEYKTLDKQEKKNYKTIKKAQKYFDKGRKLEANHKNFEKFHLKALSYNPYLWPAYHNLSEYYYLKQEYSLCVKNSDTLLQNTTPTSFPLYYLTLLRNFTSYFLLNSYEDAYKMAMKYINAKDNPADKRPAYLVISNSLLHIAGDKTKNYNNALTYANKNLNSENHVQKYQAHLVRYHVYVFQKRKDLAKKEAQEMIKIEPTTNSYVYLAEVLNSKKEKIEALKTAQSLSQNDGDYQYCFVEICKIEQSKIDETVKKLGLYVKKPDWKEIYNSTKYGTKDYWYSRIDNFFASTNKCMNEYKGQNLVACFNQVNLDQEKLTKDLEEEMFRQQQLAYQQELIRQQQIQNYYQSQSAYYARQNYYNSTRPKTYTVTPIGNSYHVNQW